MGKVLTLDIGATYLRGGIYNRGRIDKFRKIKHATNKKKFLKELLTLTKELANGESISCIAISTAGVVKEGKYIFSPNMPWLKGFNIEDFFKKYFDVPIFIENDANCFSYAEYKLIYPKEKSLIGLTIGSGIGMGIILNGEIYRGHNGFAGEIGHVKNLNYDNGEWEYYCSSKLFGKKTIESIEENVKGLLENIFYLFDPGVVVIGGGLGSALRLKNIKPNTNLKISKTKLGENVNLVGASLLALDNLKKRRKRKRGKKSR